MPDPTTVERLRGLVLSAAEIKDLTGWPGPMVEDYLNIIDNLIEIANLLDVEIDQKIEEIDTDFLDGSIPYADSNKLVEDNTRLFWDSVNFILKIAGQIQSTGRLKGQVVVTVAESPYTILKTDETVIADTDTGNIVLNLPAGVDSTAYRIVSSGTSGNTTTLTPNGTELLFGFNNSETLYDLEHLDIQYSSKGWN